MLHTSFGRWNPITKLPDARARTAPALSFDDATMHDPRFCDLNGDGHTDVCGASPAGIVCAFSIGAAWTTPTVWITSEEARVVGWNLASAEGAFALGDINGDGRDDICGRGSLGVVCGLSP